jgi:hypothetical protein
MALQGAPYIYDISRLRVNTHLCEFTVFLGGGDGGGVEYIIKYEHTDKYK